MSHANRSPDQHRARAASARVAATAAVTVLALGAAPAGAQLPDVLPPAVHFDGEISSRGELYAVDGREQRRPSSIGNLGVRANLVLFGTVTVGLDLLLSTEGGSGVGLGGSSGRQQLNRIGITPSWSWGRAYLGSFTDSYSPLTWSGVRVQGAGAMLTPGPLRAGAFVGRSQSSVGGGALDGAYSRTLWGARLGLGRPSERGGGFVDFIFLRAADDPASLATPTTDGEPVDGGIVPINPYAVTPQENVVLASAHVLPFWARRLVWRGEVALSVHSRDVRAPELSDEALDEYSSLLRSMITPRASTYGDLAYTGELKLSGLELPGATREKPRSVSASIGFRHVGAGYVSLGLASLPADQRALDLGASLRYGDWNASVQTRRQHDNLLGQKLATTVRDRVAATVSLRSGTRLTSSVRAGVNGVDNDALDPDHRVDFTGWTVTTSQALRFPRESRYRSLSWSHSYQTSRDATPGREGNDLRAHDADVRLSIAPRESLTLTPGIGMAVSRQGAAEWAIRHTWSMAGHLRGDEGRWSVGAALANSRLHDGGSLRASLRGSYRLGGADRVQAELRSNRVTGLSTATGGFSEYVFSIGWSRSLR